MLTYLAQPPNSRAFRTWIGGPGVFRYRVGENHSDGPSPKDAAKGSSLSRSAFSARFRSVVRIVDSCLFSSVL